MKLKITNKSSMDSVSGFDFGFVDIGGNELFDIVVGNVKYELPFGNAIDIEKVINNSLDKMFVDERFKSAENFSSTSFPLVVISLYDYTYGKDRGEKLFTVAKDNPFELVIKGMLEEENKYIFEIVE